MTTARTLKDYRPQHDANCSKHYCSVCGTRHRNKRILYGPHEFHDFSGHPCSCGLADLLAVAGDRRQEEEKDDGAGLGGTIAERSSADNT